MSNSNQNKNKNKKSNSNKKSNNDNDPSKRRRIGGFRSIRHSSMPNTTTDSTSSNTTTTTKDINDITPQGIQKVLQHEFPVQVFLSLSNNKLQQIYDGNQVFTVQLLPSVEQFIQQQEEAIPLVVIRIDGILERPHSEPFIVLTTVTFVRCADAQEWNAFLQSSQKNITTATSSAATTTTTTTTTSATVKPPTRVGGHIPLFLQNWAPFLSNEELAGNNSGDSDTSSCITSSNNNNNNNNITHNSQTSSSTVITFLEQHAARQALQRNRNHYNNNNSNSSSNSATNTSSTTTTTTATTVTNNNNNESSDDVYWRAIQEFQQIQFDKQSTSLTSNAGRETAAIAEKVVTQHRQALEQAWSDTTSPFTPSLLSQWHSILLQGLHNQAGRFRTKHVKVGTTQFRPPSHVATDIEMVCHILQHTLRPRLLHISSSPSSTVSQIPASPTAATFAAAVFMAIVDVHPFADGNGRLARIALNWAIQKAGFPFCINWCATSQQRHELAQAIQQTRRNTCLQAYGQVTQEQLLEAYQNFGALRPLVQWILHRWNKTIIEFQTLFQEKSAHANEQEEARAARRVRERAATGPCLICLDDHPNMATLCCGKAVHLNCMAEWLAQQTNCPQCRKELPAWTRPAQHHNNNNNEESPSRHHNTTTNDDDDDTNSTVSGPELFQRLLMDHMVRHVLDVTDNERETSGDHDSHSTTEEDEEDDDYDDDEEEDGLNHHHDTTQETTEQEDDNDDTSNDTAANDTTTYIPNNNDRRPLPPVCSYRSCHNRSARDCANDACGKCCVTWGHYGCYRHNTLV